MNRYTVRMVGAVVGLIILGVVYWSRKSASSEDFRKQAHVLVAKADGYAARPDYYDWLVDTAHDEVFSGAYHVEFRGRYSQKAHVDRGAYMQGLFESMLEHAKEDKAQGVVDAITKLRDGGRK
jgi:hypothetical protein